MFFPVPLFASYFSPDTKGCSILWIKCRICPPTPEGWRDNRVQIRGLYKNRRYRVEGTANKRQQIGTLITANDGTLFRVHFAYNKLGLGKLPFKYFENPEIIGNKHKENPSTFSNYPHKHSMSLNKRIVNYWHTDVHICCREWLELLNRRGVVIMPDEFGPYWLELLEKTDLNVLGIHPGLTGKTLTRCSRPS